MTKTPNTRSVRTRHARRRQVLIQARERQITAAFGAPDTPYADGKNAQVEADPTMNTLLVLPPWDRNSVIPESPVIVLPMDERIIPAEKRVQALKDARDIIHVFSWLPAVATPLTPQELALLPAQLCADWTRDLEWWCGEGVFAPDDVTLRLSVPGEEGGLQFSFPRTLFPRLQHALAAMLEELK